MDRLAGGDAAPVLVGEGISFGVLERRLDVPQPVLAAEAAAANVPAVDVLSARRTAQRHRSQIRHISSLFVRTAMFRL